MLTIGNNDPEPFVSDLLPRAGSRWCEYEKKALAIRKMAGVDITVKFDPESLARLLNFEIIRLTALDGLSDQIRSQVSGDHWSGAAICTDQLNQDCAGLIIINDLQSPRRQRATLMEEICHLLLDHKPSRLSGAGRTYDRQIEEEAYAVGAATLLPYKPLRELLISGRPGPLIANHFDVSTQLVRYRIRVLGLQSLSISTPIT
ncbi:MAG: hypothetical protein RIR52_2361 [Acidobacteriota bacterium]|jgi:Zn-dependent peptidase ImmA (M78 family)